MVSGMAGVTARESISRTRVKALVVWLLAPLLAASISLSLAADPAHAATFTVNTTGDENDLDFPGGEFDGSSDGNCDVASSTAGDQCTLRAAIQEANTTTNEDTINFGIPEDPNNTADDIKTIMVGSTAAPGSGESLPIITEPVTINGYTQAHASPNAERDAQEGTDANLVMELNGAFTGSTSIGVRINASNVVVKGLVINRFQGGIFTFGESSDVVIQGNFIGTDPSGLQNPGNSDYGVTIFGNSSSNTIGGQEPAARNLISGNLFRGLVISDAGGNTVQGNLIGTQANGTGSMGNGLVGVQVSSPNNTVGGIDSDPHDNLNPANLIAFNGGDGVRVTGGRNNAFAVGNRILGNSIHSNGDLGIDLDGGQAPSADGDGVTTNDGDRKDRDTGPNNLQNFPVISSARMEGTTVTIKGMLRSAPRKTFTIQFFSSPAADASGYGEGKSLLLIGETSVRTNRRGKAVFTFPAELTAAERVLTATATNDLTGDTSEFSRAVTAN